MCLVWFLKAVIFVAIFHLNTSSEIRALFHEGKEGFRGKSSPNIFLPLSSDKEIPGFFDRSF